MGQAGLRPPLNQDHPEERVRDETETEFKGITVLFIKVKSNLNNLS